MPAITRTAKPLTVEITTPITLALTISGAGMAGAILTVLNIKSPITGPLTLLFLLIQPALCVAMLLPSLTPLARTIISGAMSIILACVIAELMLLTKSWSPQAAVVTTATICATTATTAALLRRKSPKTEPTSPNHPETEDWLYEG